MSTAEDKARDAVVSLGAKLAARGLCPGTSGNISVKVSDGWLMTPTNSSLGELDPDKLSKLDSSGKHVGGDPPTKEALLHRSVYDVRPKDGAIVHLHCTHAVAISCLDPSCHHNNETTLPPITPYFVMRVGKLPLVLTAYVYTYTLPPYFTTSLVSYWAVLLQSPAQEKRTLPRSIS